MERIIVNGVALEVQRIAAGARGRGAPVVFLHEGLGSAAMWRGWPADLCRKAGRDGIVYSRRGYGQSDPIPDVRGAGRLAPDYMHQEAWEVLPALLGALNTPAPILLGHSDGGSIALLHASRFPVHGCIVMAPHVVVEEISIGAIDQARQAFLGGDLRQRLAAYHADVDAAFWQWNDAWLNPAFRSFDIRSDCRHIAAPVLALQGLDDPYGTLRQIDEIAPTAGHFETEKLAACGHSPHRDRTEYTTERIVRFLAGLD